MIVSLFTLRVVLNTLGVIDYGIFNVIAGIVLMFSFLSNTMASASLRFFAFDLGKNDIHSLNQTFSMTITIYVIISAIVFILAESIGLWFLNTQMVIPIDRIGAANWIYQFSVFSFIVTILVIPYNAVILARENMSSYAFVSIIDVLLKLVIVYILLLFSVDKLKLYTVLVFITTCITSVIYIIICRRKYKECRFELHWDTRIFKSLISYSSWSLFGAVSSVLNNQGINILLNIFFGPVVNAARGIAYQLNSAVNQFVLNFHVAVRPQITKYYATEKNEEMLKLVFTSSKLSYFLIFIISMPILLETNYLLKLWLKDVPEYVVLFSRLVIITALIDSLSYAMQTAASATGKIKLYQSIVGGMLLINLPLSYVLLKLGQPPQATMYVAIIISIICLFLRLWVLRSLIDLPIRDYFQKVLKGVILVSIVAYIIPLIIFLKLDENIIRLIIVGISAILSSSIAIYYIGITDLERIYLTSLIKAKMAMNKQ